MKRSPGNNRAWALPGGAVRTRFRRASPVSLRRARLRRWFQTCRHARWTRARSFNGFAEGSNDRDTSDALWWNGTYRAAPAPCRAPALATATPARFKAVRWPATAWSAASSMHLHSAHPHAPACGKDFQFILFANRARDQRACDHGAEPFMVKTRSMGRRASAEESCAGTSAATLPAPASVRRDPLR